MTLQPVVLVGIARTAGPPARARRVLADSGGPEAAGRAHRAGGSR